ncbi:hypothetical protein GCM10027568_26580 [Humibacter soli]
MSRPRILTVSAVALAALASALFLGAAPASAAPATVTSTSPGTIFVGNVVDAQIQVNIPANATPAELPTSFSWSTASGSNPSTSAIRFTLETVTPGLGPCVLNSSGTGGTCDLPGAAPGESETLNVQETATASPIGVQHLTFSQQTPGGTQSAGAQDINVIDSVGTASAVVSTHTVAIGGTVTVTATITLAKDAANYLPPSVGVWTATDLGSGATSLSFTRVSSTGPASSCGIGPDTREIGCQLVNAHPGDTITITGVATATLKSLGDFGASPLGLHHVFVGFGATVFPIPAIQTDQDITVTAASAGSGGSGSTGTPSTGATPTDPSDPSQGATVSDPSTTTTTATDPTSAQLADTGSDVWPATIAAVLFLGAGAVLFTRSRRRA